MPHKAAGISGLAIGLGYIAIIALYVPIGVPSSAVEARLTHVANHATAWSAILALSVVTDLLFAPLVLGLYEILKPVSRNLMLLACALVGLFIILDLAITWTNYAVMITLGSRFALAGDASQKSAIAIAAEYPNAVLQSSVLFVYNSLTLGAGIGVT